MEETVMSVWMMTSSTVSLRSSSATARATSSSIWIPSGSPSATRGLQGDVTGAAHLLRVDVVEGRALLEAVDLALGGVALGQDDVRRSTGLFGRRLHPLDQLLEGLAHRP